MERNLATNDRRPDRRGRLAAQLLGPVRLRTCDGIPWSREREAAAAAAQARLWSLVGMVARERRLPPANRRVA